MKFHPKKCNLLRVTGRKKPITTSYRNGGHQLEEVKTTIYLGVILGKDLSWKAHVKMMTCKPTILSPYIAKCLRLPQEPKGA